MTYLTKHQTFGRGAGLLRLWLLFKFLIMYWYCMRVSISSTIETDTVLLRSM